jgi:DNA-binding NarL/FixJ family response regulator
MTEIVRVAVVDDHPLFREGVVHVLREAEAINVVAEGGSAADAVRIAVESQPDVMLLDLNMPGGGLVAAESIYKECPSTKVLILTVSEEEDDIVGCIRAGVCGYVLKGVSSSDLIRTVIDVQRGDVIITPGLAARMLNKLTSNSAESESEQLSTELTGREHAILKEVALGMTNKEVARILSLSEKTIKHHMTSIMQKLHVRNRVEAAMRMRSATE